MLYLDCRIAMKKEKKMTEPAWITAKREAYNKHLADVSERVARWGETVRGKVDDLLRPYALDVLNQMGFDDKDTPEISITSDGNVWMKLFGIQTQLILSFDGTRVSSKLDNLVQSKDEKELMDKINNLQATMQGQIGASIRFYDESGESINQKLELNGFDDIHIYDQFRWYNLIDVPVRGE